MSLVPFAAQASFTNNVPPFPLPKMVTSPIVPANLRSALDAKDGPVLLTNIAPETKAIFEQIEDAKQEVVALEFEVFTANPLLLAIEQYRDIPRDWFEDHYYAKQTIMTVEQEKAKTEGNTELSKALTEVWTLCITLASRELLREPIYAEMLDAVSTKLPPNKSLTSFSQLDQKIGYLSTNQPTATEKKSAWTLREMDARYAAIEKRISQLQTDVGVSAEYVDATRIKARIITATEYCDIYIGTHLPKELKDARFKLRQLRIKLGNAARH